VPIGNTSCFYQKALLSEELLDMMADHNLKLLLPAETITYPHRTTGTMIDLVWGNAKAEERTIKCQISKKHDHGSDHLPIEIVIDLQPLQCIPSKPAYNFNKTNWKSLEYKLQNYLPKTLDPKHANPETVDQYANKLTKALQKAIDETT